MRIGIFGGTFNCIHFGHLVLAEQAFEKLKLDKVIFIPSYLPPHKKSRNMASAAERFAMVKLAIQENKRFSVSDIEIQRKGRSYSIDTIRKLHEMYPKARFYFISGSDVSDQIGKWKSIDEILRLATFVLAKRPGYHLKKYTKNIVVISITELDISSSMIRRKIRTGQSVRYLMPGRVYNYIKEKGLYK